MTHMSTRILASLLSLGLVLPAASEEAPKTEPRKLATRDATVARQLTLDLGNRASMKLTLIPAGKFLMGSPPTEPDRDNAHADETQHEVTLTKAFYLGVTEVTQKQYQAVMGVHPSRFKGENLPVEPVSWVEAVEFCRKLSEKTGKTVRLPTEAEWEYACRAGTTGAYAGTGKLDEMGWHKGNSGGRTHPVAGKRPNAWGLYDMHGNVWEWCADWFGPYSGDATDPQGVSIETARAMRTGPSRIMRGGCWFYGPPQCRAATRGRGAPENRLTGPGFRVALEATPAAP